MGSPPGRFLHRQGRPSGGLDFCFDCGLPSSNAFARNTTSRGEVSERPKEHAWKACIRVSVSRVQISSSPPESSIKRGDFCRLFFFWKICTPILQPLRSLRNLLSLFVILSNILTKSTSVRQTTAASRPLAPPRDTRPAILSRGTPVIVVRRCRGPGEGGCRCWQASPTNPATRAVPKKQPGRMPPTPHRRGGHVLSLKLSPTVGRERIAPPVSHVYSAEKSEHKCTRVPC